MKKVNFCIISFLIFSIFYIYGLETTVEDSNLIDELFYKDKIPEEYYNAFLYYTKDFPEIRLPFYSIMVHESGNFRKFESTNKNGSKDYGPSQLNSNNLNNPLFIEYYDTNDKSCITSEYCYYMVMTINFYKDLVNKHGEEYAFYAYNGGEGCIKLIKNNIKDPQYESLLRNVKRYNESVRKILNDTSLELEEFIDKINEEKEIENTISIENLDKNEIVNHLPILIRKNIIKFCNYIIFYTRRKDLFDFQFEEIGVVANSCICAFEIQTT